MTGKRNAPATTEADQVQPTVDVYPTEFHRINQAIRLPSAMRYYLNRYRDDLKPHTKAGDHRARVMLAHCNDLLASADRIEG